MSGSIRQVQLTTKYPGHDPYDPGSSIGITSDLFKFIEIETIFLEIKTIVTLLSNIHER